MFVAKNKTTKIISWVLVVPMTVFLLLAGGTKIAGVNPLGSVETMSDWVFLIGLGEVTAALLFAIPRTSILGALALSAHLGGAIVFHIIRGESFLGGSIFTSFWFQSAFLASVWIVTVLRYPAILRNFEG